MFDDQPEDPELFYFVRVNPKIQSKKEAQKLRDALQVLFGLSAVVQTETKEEAYR